MSAYAIGDAVESLDPTIRKRFGYIMEITDDRVRIAWAEPPEVKSTWRRTWLARSAFGKRWRLVDPSNTGGGR